MARQLFAAGAAIALTNGCGGSGAAPQSSPGRSDDQQSIAEYDVARDLWIRRNQPREALEHALKALDFDEDNAEAAHMISLIYLDFCRQGPTECRLEDAERYARQALDAAPQFREATNTLGVILVHQKRYTDAVATLKPLTEDILYQTPENAWGNLGWAYLEKGSLDPAIDALKRSIAAQPNFCVGHYRLALAYERKKDPHAALTAFNRALDNDQRCKGLQEAYSGRARVLLQLDRTDEARSDLKDCVRLDKSTPAGRECGALLGKLDYAGIWEWKRSDNICGAHGKSAP
jgi:Tfp pilus assembly protein PilF